MLQTLPKASATAVPAIFPPALKSTQVCFRMNIGKIERLVFFGVIQFVELTFCVRTLFDVLAVSRNNNLDFFIQLNNPPE